MATKKITVADAAAKAKADIAKKKADEAKKAAERAKALQARTKLDNKPSKPVYGDNIIEKGLDKVTGIAESAINWLSNKTIDAAKKEINKQLFPIRATGKVAGKIPGVKPAADAFAQGGKQVADTVNELAAGRPSEAGKAFVGKKNVTNPNIVGQITHGLTLGDEAKRFVRGKTTAMDVANVALMFGGGAVEKALIGRGFSRAEVNAFKESDAVKKAIKAFESNAPKDIVSTAKSPVVKNAEKIASEGSGVVQGAEDLLQNSEGTIKSLHELATSQNGRDLTDAEHKILDKFHDKVGKNPKNAPDWYWTNEAKASNPDGTAEEIAADALDIKNHALRNADYHNYTQLGELGYKDSEGNPINGLHASVDHYFKDQAGPDLVKGAEDYLKNIPHSKSLNIKPSSSVFDSHFHPKDPFSGTNNIGENILYGNTTDKELNSIVQSWTKPHSDPKVAAEGARRFNALKDEMLSTFGSSSGKGMLRDEYNKALKQLDHIFPDWKTKLLPDAYVEEAKKFSQQALDYRARTGRSFADDIIKMRADETASKVTKGRPSAAPKTVAEWQKAVDDYLAKTGERGVPTVEKTTGARGVAAVSNEAPKTPSQLAEEARQAAKAARESKASADAALGIDEGPLSFKTTTEPKPIEKKLLPELNFNPDIGVANWKKVQKVYSEMETIVQELANARIELEYLRTTRAGRTPRYIELAGGEDKAGLISDLTKKLKTKLTRFNTLNAGVKPKTVEEVLDEANRAMNQAGKRQAIAEGRVGPTSETINVGTGELESNMTQPNMTPEIAGEADAQAAQKAADKAGKGYSRQEQDSVGKRLEKSRAAEKAHYDAMNARKAFLNSSDWEGKISPFDRREELRAIAGGRWIKDGKWYPDGGRGRPPVK